MSEIEKLRKLGLSGKNFLVVDDNDLNREVASEMLKLTGAEVLCAEDGLIAAETVDSCGEGFFSLILMDVNMPNMDGYDAAAKIRAPGTSYRARLPIVTCSASMFAEDIYRAAESGISDSLEKPINIGKLRELLEKWVV